MAARKKPRPAEDAQAIFDKMDMQEREVLCICAAAAESRDDALCDGVVCFYFVTKKLMRIAPDGFVMSPLGLEVVKRIAHAHPTLFKADPQQQDQA